MDEDTVMAKGEVGDEVFFYFKGEPLVGKVLCAGRHGCTVDHDGSQHRLKWHQISGYKKRAPQTYKILDQGEDGVIVENQDGRRRYLGIPPEARDEHLKLTPKQIHGVHK